MGDSMVQRDRIGWRDEGKLLGRVKSSITTIKRNAATAELPSPSRPIASTSSSTLMSPVLALGINSKSAPELRPSKPKGARSQSLALRLRKKPRKAAGDGEQGENTELLDENELRRLAELERRMKIGSSTAASAPSRPALAEQDSNLKGIAGPSRHVPSVQMTAPTASTSRHEGGYPDRESPPSPSPQPRSSLLPPAKEVELETKADDSDDLFDDSLDIPLSQLPETLDQTVDEMPSLIFSGSSHDTTADDSISSIVPDMRRTALLKTATTQRSKSVIVPAPSSPAQVDETELPAPSQSQRVLGTSKRRGDASQDNQKLRNAFVPPKPRSNARKPILAPLHPECVEESCPL